MGPPDSGVLALAVAGNDLYVGGFFKTAGGNGANYIAKWNGTNWSALGSGMSEEVWALAVLGGDLYAAGDFLTAGGREVHQIAKWNGSSWSALGSGIEKVDGFQTPVYALAVVGSELYAGGNFTWAGAGRANQIAKWNGSSWSALGSGMRGVQTPSVRALAVSGSDLYAGGRFTSVNGIAADGIAKFSGTSWNELGSGMNERVYTLAVSGADLYIGGAFAAANGIAVNSIAKFNGTSWNALGSGMGKTNGSIPVVYAIAIAESNLYAGGRFTTAGGAAAISIAKWNGNTWSALDSGLRTTDNSTPVVYALAVTGSDLYAGGNFTRAGGNPANGIAKWNGSSWSPLGSGMDGTVSALAISGGDLYAAGSFTRAGGSPANQIAKWNGSSWNSLGLGMSDAVLALAVSGSDLYAGGYFTMAGGSPANRIAKWNGSSWSPLGSGIGRTDGYTPVVSALAVSGSDLYVGGYFTTADGSPANRIAKWNANGWSALGSGVGGVQSYRVHALTVSGTDLYAGGLFTTAGGKPSAYIARAFLGEIHAPKFTLQPQSKTTNPGELLQLEGSATAAPAPTYQWRLNGVNIPDATQSRLVITNAVASDGGSYQLVAENGGGVAVSDIATVIVTSPSLGFQNHFADRTVLQGTFMTGSGSNTNATKEPGEIRHAGKIGGKSIWLAWRAPASGVATLNTRGSTFDTLLAVYTGNSMTNLSLLISDDDQGGFLTSKASFNAVAGNEYQIAIDGFAGAGGHIVLSLTLDTSHSDFPRIITQPLSQTLSAGVDTFLRVVLATNTTPVTFQWFQDCQKLEGQTNASLIITNFQRFNVGRYTVMIQTAGGLVAESQPAVLELGPEPKKFSYDKVEDLLADAGLIDDLMFRQNIHSAALSFGFVSVAAGSINSQSLSTYGATTQIGEQNHCGRIGGASRWFGLQPDSDGLLEIDTIGSNYDTVLAVYEFKVPLLFQEVACDDNSAPDGQRSRLLFQARRNARYLVALDGIGGAHGSGKINWNMTGQPARLSLNTQWVSGRLDLRITAPASNRSCILQGSDDLSVWSNLVTNAPNTALNFQDASATNRTMRFYRVMWTP